jgi:hypothetical protein
LPITVQLMILDLSVSIKEDNYLTFRTI